MEITNYIEPELYIIVPVLYALGGIFKKSTVVSDRWIPVILGVMGVVLSTVYKFGIYTPSNSETLLSVLYAGFTQGILCAAASVYTNNIIKQLKKNDDESDNESDNSAG